MKSSLLFTAVGIFFELAWWLLIGGAAAFWWAPSYFGEPNGIPWLMGAMSLLMLWVWVFNHWPRLGTKRFFQETRGLQVKLILLGAITVSFYLGFELTA